jgi:hypothetical protein
LEHTGITTPAAIRHHITIPLLPKKRALTATRPLEKAALIAAVVVNLHCLPIGLSATEAGKIRE